MGIARNDLRVRHAVPAPRGTLDQAVEQHRLDATDCRRELRFRYVLRLELIPGRPRVFCVVFRPAAFRIECLPENLLHPIAFDQKRELASKAFR